MRTLADAVYGAAVADAVGVPYEFKERDTFECTDMVGYGTYNLPMGTFSDDTSMILATCDSLKANDLRIDCDDMRARFCDWAFEGAYTASGTFDIGNATYKALRTGMGCMGVRENGNGSLMRIIPLAFMQATDDDVRAVSAITHAHPISTESCVIYIHVARALMQGASILEALKVAAERAAQAQNVQPDLFSRIDGIQELTREEIASSGYVLHSLEASLWCLANTSSYAECVLTAVNLGKDTDTTACIAGGLAGIFYGKEAIPASWLEGLRAKDIIENVLFA